MVEPSVLTYDTFLVMARHMGMAMEEAHLQELFPEVEAMFRRIALLERVDASGIDPASIPAPAHTGSPE